MKRQSLDPRVASLVAIMIAVVYVLTRLVQIPIGSQGFVHLGDAAIYFAAFAFGPWVAAVAGAELHSEHFLARAITTWCRARAVSPAPTLEFEAVPGRGLRARTDDGAILILIVGYFFAGILLTGIGEAVTGVLPNVLQALSGGIVGIPLFAAVLRAYPPLAQWGAFGHWTE